MSHTLLISAAVSRPLLVSNVPGCKELVSNNNGYVFEKNNPIDMFEKIKKFYYLDYKNKLLMGKKSRELVDKYYNVDFVIKSYIKIIQKIRI